MNDLRLKIERQWYGVMNTLAEKEKRRNALIDSKREFKKDKEKSIRHQETVAEDRARHSYS